MDICVYIDINIYVSENNKKNRTIIHAFFIYLASKKAKKARDETRITL